MVNRPWRAGDESSDPSSRLTRPCGSWDDAPPLDGHRGLDRGVRHVVHELEVLELVVEDAVRLADLHGRERVRVTCELFGHLFDVVVVDVGVTRRPDELAEFEPHLLGHHHRQ